MRKRQLLLIGGVAFFGALIFAQTLPSTLPSVKRPLGPRPGGGEARLFHLNGKKFVAKMTQEEVISGPEWTPPAPLPLGLAQAEEIARRELRKLVANESTWEVTEFDLRRLRHQGNPKWHYAVSLRPALGRTNAGSDFFL